MKISYTQINNECNELHNLAMNINETIRDLNNLNNSLRTNDAWSGQASNHYYKKFKDILKNFNNFSQEIENSILFLANTAEGYAAVDNMVMSQICNNLNISAPNLSKSRIFKQ